MTGLPLTTTDANGLETRIEYDTATLRPLNVKTYFNNVQVGTTAETVYHDETNNYWVKNRTQIDANNWAESITYFDGLGRAYKAEEVNSQGNIFVEKEFDQDGRVLRVTNPFRSGETKQWTTNVYDEASRIKEVVLPDGATIKTDYGVSTASGFVGAVVTVTDQANKQRRSITNALGQLVRVDEPDTNGSLGTIASPNQPTFYNYNTIGKMTKVSQGVQNRYFLYDSLGRLLRVRQPEQTVNANLNTTGNPDNNSWTAAFGYDDNGNILTATDAKGVSMTYDYDNLNRIKTRSYSDSTPAVTYKYDNLSHAKGNLIEVSSSVSTSKTTAFNDLGQPTSYQQITDGNTYQTTYQYNSFGTLTGETYPSGRKVNYDFNADGDLSRVWGENGNGCTSNCLKTYANAFNYNSAGAVEKLRLGNGKWETAKYNNRLQIIEIGVGNGSNDASLWKTSYEYGELNTNGTVDTTKNSGNVAKQTLSFAGLTNPIVQTYKYDSLDRLTEAEEKSNGTQTWIQQFGYDRYGNRTSFNQLIGSQQTNTTPTVDTNTNRFTTGQGYVYDLNGNLIQDAEGRQFTFNGDNKQTDVKDSQNNPIGEYFYDGEGKRIKKITNTEITVFVYNGSGQLIAEYSTQTNSSPTTSYLTNDNLGSPRVITDALGNVISRRDFMPFGEEIYSGIGGRTENQKYTQNGVDNIRKRFTGYEKDTETGLDFAEARYYHNEHGRFTAVDPLLASGKSANPQTFNRYIYTMNNPINLVDPSGMISESTGACGSRCINSGPMVDSVDGIDTSFAWAQFQTDCGNACPPSKADQRRMAQKKSDGTEGGADGRTIPRNGPKPVSARIVKAKTGPNTFERPDGKVIIGGMTYFDIYVTGDDGKPFEGTITETVESKEFGVKKTTITSGAVKLEGGFFGDVMIGSGAYVYEKMPSDTELPNILKDVDKIPTSLEQIATFTIQSERTEATLTIVHKRILTNVDADGRLFDEVNGTRFRFVNLGFTVTTSP